jgi:hypothetical protein
MLIVNGYRRYVPDEFSPFFRLPAQDNLLFSIFPRRGRRNSRL